jgi:hypothetical protein
LIRCQAERISSHIGRSKAFSASGRSSVIVATRSGVVSYRIVA